MADFVCHVIIHSGEVQLDLEDISLHSSSDQVHIFRHESSDAAFVTLHTYERLGVKQHAHQHSTTT